MAGWQSCVEGLEREERKRWGALPAGEALYGTAGFRDRSRACILCCLQWNYSVNANILCAGLIGWEEWCSELECWLLLEPEQLEVRPSVPH